jgi:hypothetical protein
MSSTVFDVGFRAPWGAPPSMSSFLSFLLQDMSRADVIATIALLVGLLSASYARRQAEEAKQARLAAIRESRRPHRLEVFRSMQSFCLFCSRYYTTYLMNKTAGTRDLVAGLESFRWEMEQAAVYEMPEVAARAKLLESWAWGLQRHIDRLGAQSSVAAVGPSSTEDEAKVQELSDAFAHERTSLMSLFAPYLADPTLPSKQ